MANNGLIEIKNATIVNEGQIFKGNVIINNDVIERVTPSEAVLTSQFSHLTSPFSHLRF